MTHFEVDPPPQQTGEFQHKDQSLGVISRFLNSRFIRNYLVFSYGSIAIAVVPLIIVPFEARSLGVDGYGQLGLIIAIMTYFTLSVTLGFPRYSIRQISAGVDDESHFVGTVISVRLVLALIGMAFLAIAPSLLQTDVTFSRLLLVYSLMLPLVAFDLSWYFQAKEMMKVVSQRQILRHVCYILLLVPLLILYPRPLVVIVALVLSNFIATVFLLKRFLDLGNRLNINQNLPDWISLAIASIPLGIASITATINTYFNQVVLGSSLDTTQLGYYVASWKLVSFFLLVANNMFQVGFPIIANAFARDDRSALSTFLHRYFALMVLLAIISSLGTFIIAPSLVNLLFGPSYTSSIIVLQILSLGLFPITCMAIYFASSLIALGQFKEYAIVSIFGSMISIISSLLLVPRFGLLGASFALIFTELTILLFAIPFFLRALDWTWAELVQLLNVWKTLRATLREQSKGLG